MKVKFGTRIREINKRNIWRIVYVVVVKYLPRSCYSVTCLRIRAWVAKHVVLYMGKNVNIEKNVTFGSELCIGDNSTIGFNSDLYGPVEIGSNVLIGPELVVFTNGHRYDRNDVPIIEQGDTPHEKVVIEDNVWIGRRVIILPGVTIKKGSVVGAGAVVTKTFPENCVIAGNPAHIVKKRFECTK